jgi:hypothetical protein
MEAERCAWCMEAWWFRLKRGGRGPSSPTPQRSCGSTCLEGIKVVSHARSAQVQSWRLVLPGRRGYLLQALTVPLEIGYRELDGQVDDVGSPGDLCIDGPTLNPEERGPMFLLVPEW